MSAYTPIVRAMRAEAKAMHDLADEVKEACGAATATVFLYLASAKLAAADALEAEQREREAKVLI